MPGIENAGVVVLALVIIYILLKDVVAPMVRKANGGSTSGTTIPGMVRDLWEWHKPDERGRQSWKDMGTIHETLVEIKDETIECRNILTELCRIIEKDKS